MIVVDATVLADFSAGESQLKEKVVALMREDPDWVSVGLWRYEFGNVMWKKVKFGDGDPVDSRMHLRCVGKLLLETVDDVDLEAVHDIAVETGLTFYDASYVWLARTRGLFLRTRDKHVLRECPDVAHPMPVV